MAWAVVTLGSNIRGPVYLPRAVAALAQMARVARLSQVYETPPVGTAGPPFLNAAVLLALDLPAEDLRARLRAIEARLGRVRGADPNAPRTLDLDALLYRTPDGAEALVLNRREMGYAHAVVPAAEVAGHWVVEGRPLFRRAAAFAAQAQGFRPRVAVWSAMMAALSVNKE